MHASEISRRQFLKIAGATSLAGSLPRRSLSSPRSARPARFAEFHALRPGSVRPEGWIALYLEKQAKGLGLHLPEISWPFTDLYWGGKETPPSQNGWWPWEQKGYWIDGALRCALVTGNTELLPRAQAPVDYTLAHASPDGYLGPRFAKDAKEDNPATDNFRWPHTVFFRALAAHGEVTGDPSVAAAMRKHFLSDHAPYGGPSRDVTNVEGMLWAYERTGDRQLLVMAETAWKHFLASAEPGDYESGDLHPDRVYANTRIRAHGVTYIEKAKLPALLYMHTGDAESLRFALAAQQRIFDHHMLISGIPSTSENYGAVNALASHETCDISDHIWTWGYLLMATGDGVWGDRIERAVFNAGMGAIKKDWKALQYFSSPNQILATLDSDHTPGHLGDRQMAYQPNPGHDVACCGGNVHRFLPNYVLRMWMQTKDGGLAATLYGRSTVIAKVGTGQTVTIHQETDYPFGEEIHFTLQSLEPITFPLALRIPQWCANPSLFLNDKPMTLPALESGFFRLVRRFQPGDRITLVLPMKPALTDWPNNDIGIERGPLVYSLPVKEDWTSVVEPKWSTAEFPEWNANPAEAWNYGVAADETELLKKIEIVHKGASEDPFVNPPTQLSAPFRQIPGWQMDVDPHNSQIRRTPPLPRLERDSLKTALEAKTLVPYGSTHLRLTILPQTVLA